MRKEYYLLIIVFVVFSIYGVNEVLSTEYLFSYDPYYHNQISMLTVDSGNTITELDYFDSKQPINYYSSLYTLTASFSLITGLDMLIIYKLGGLLFRLSMVLFVFFIVKELTKNKFSAILASILFISIPYIIFRSLLTYPEHVAILTHLMLAYVLFKDFNKIKKIILTSLLFSISLYAHPKLAIIPFILLATYFLLELFKKNYKTIIKIISLSIILTLPLLHDLMIKIKGLLEWNVGSSAKYISSAVGDARYAFGGFDYYLSFGILLIFLFIISIPKLLLIKKEKKIILIIWFLFSLLLTLGPLIHLYIPLDRVKSYFVFPLIFIASVGISYLFNNKNVVKNVSKICLFSFAIFVFGLNLLMTQGWVGINQDVGQAGNWLNEHLDENSIFLSLDNQGKLSPDKLFINDPGKYLYEGSKLISREGFSHEFIYALKDAYPSKNIYLISENSLNLDSLVYKTNSTNPLYVYGVK